MRFHNTATRAIEEFEPLEAGHVRMYTCGPTVWNLVHVGNLRTFLFYDLLRRHLIASGYRVTHVLNLTDVEDRIILRAAEQGVTIRQYVQPFERAFFEDLGTLRVQRPEHVPRATEHVGGMMALIQTLLERGYAYPAEGDVYYRVDAFPDYGKLAHLDRRGLKAGARVSADTYDKQDVVDFALWKGEQTGEADVGAVWEAPFGRGRPGWHIECSAMSLAYLGPTFDLHAGGIDLLFPHHQNEVAQSEAANQAPFVRCWLHAEHLADATGEKMSKRLGNIATLHDLLDAGHDPLAIRYFLLAGAHYRQRLRLEEAALHAAGEQVRRLRDFERRVQEVVTADVDDAPLVQELNDLRSHFRAALDDDLNLPQALGYLFDGVRLSNAALDARPVGSGGRAAMLALLEAADAYLDILRGEELKPDAEIERLVEEREAARGARDFARADALREELRARGVQVKDTPSGPRLTRITTPG